MLGILRLSSGSFARGRCRRGRSEKFPMFAINCCCLPLSFRRRREKRRKGGKMRKKGENVGAGVSQSSFFADFHFWKILEQMQACISAQRCHDGRSHALLEYVGLAAVVWHAVCLRKRRGNGVPPRAGAIRTPRIFPRIFCAFLRDSGTPIFQRTTNPLWNQTPHETTLLLHLTGTSLARNLDSCCSWKSPQRWRCFMSGVFRVGWHCGGNLWTQFNEGSRSRCFTLGLWFHVGFRADLVMFFHVVSCRVYVCDAWCIEIHCFEIGKTPQVSLRSRPWCGLSKVRCFMSGWGFVSGLLVPKFFKRQNVEEKSAENGRKNGCKNGHKNLRTKNLRKNGRKNLRTKNGRKKWAKKFCAPKICAKNRFEHSICLEDGSQKKTQKKSAPNLRKTPAPKNA